jgi:hypothetical protein
MPSAAFGYVVETTPVLRYENELTYSAAAGRRSSYRIRARLQSCREKRAFNHRALALEAEHQRLKPSNFALRSAGSKMLGKNFAVLKIKDLAFS